MILDKHRNDKPSLARTKTSVAVAVAAAIAGLAFQFGPRLVLAQEIAVADVEADVAGTAKAGGEIVTFAISESEMVVPAGIAVEVGNHRFDQPAVAEFVIEDLDGKRAGGRQHAIGVEAVEGKRSFLARAMDRLRLHKGHAIMSGPAVDTEVVGKEPVVASIVEASVDDERRRARADGFDRHREIEARVKAKQRDLQDRDRRRERRDGPNLFGDAPADHGAHPFSHSHPHPEPAPLPLAVPVPPTADVTGRPQPLPKPAEAAFARSMESRMERRMERLERLVEGLARRFEKGADVAQERVKGKQEAHQHAMEAMQEQRVAAQKQIDENRRQERPAGDLFNRHPIEGNSDPFVSDGARFDGHPFQAPEPTAKAAREKLTHARAALVAKRQQLMAELKRLEIEIQRLSRVDPPQGESEPKKPEPARKYYHHDSSGDAEGDSARTRSSGKPRHHY